MNAAQLLSGQDYAYVDYISRGVAYYDNARPVRVLRKYEVEPYGATRKRTMVEVILLKEGEDGKLVEVTNTTGEVRTLSVKARNIYARWDEHANVREKKREERREQEEVSRKLEEQRAAERAQRQRELEAQREVERREYEERQRREAEENEVIKAWLDRRGLRGNDVSFTINGSITINRETILKKAGALYART